MHLAPTSTWPRLRAYAVIAGLVLILALISLMFTGSQTSTILSTVGAPISDGGTSVSDRAAGDTTAAGGDTGAGGDTAAGVDDTGSDPGFATTFDATRPDLLVIRTGTLELQVADVVTALDRARQAVAAVGGYVSGSEQTGAGDRRTATVTYRVPAAAWDSTLGALRSIADEVVTAETRTDEVTGQVVDLDARIVNLRATEAALQAIMARATEIKDVLAVQAELTGVRGQIEEATARVSHLRDQAAFSTVTVTFAPPPVAATVAVRQRFDPQAEVDRSVAQLVRVAQRAASFGIWFGIVALPILLALAVGLGMAAGLVLLTRRVVMARATRTG